MLKFNPPNYLSFTPNSQQRLESTLLIINPSSNCSAPFKIKSTKPELFTVQPSIGVISPLQQVQVSIKILGRNSSELTRQIAHDHKFKVEYVMLNRPPSNISQALRSINDQNKQIQKLYINANTPKGSYSRDQVLDAKSSISNRQTYRTVRDQSEQTPFDRLDNLKSNKGYFEMDNQQKFQHLKGQIDRYEREKSELIMAAKPKKKKLNVLVILLILIIMVIAGNLVGRSVGLNKIRSPSKSKQKQRQYKYFGLEKLWAGAQPQKQSKSWWKFWE